MAKRTTGFLLDSVGEIGLADGDKIVRFEMINPNNQRGWVHVPFEKMARFMFVLQGALQMATAERAKRPGYSASEASVRAGVKVFGTGLAYAPGESTRIVLHVQTDTGIPLDMILSTDDALDISNQLAARVEEAGTKAPPKPS